MKTITTTNEVLAAFIMLEAMKLSVTVTMTSSNKYPHIKAGEEFLEYYVTGPVSFMDKAIKKSQTAKIATSKFAAIIRYMNQA